MVNTISTLKLSVVVAMLSFISGCGGNESKKLIEFPNGEYTIPDTPEVPVVPVVPDAPVLVEIINGGFEEDVAGQMSPLSNWVFRPDQEASAVATIEVIESEEGVNSYEGTKEINSLIVGRAITGYSAFVS